MFNYEFIRYLRSHVAARSEIILSLDGVSLDTDIHRPTYLGDLNVYFSY